MQWLVIPSVRLLEGPSTNRRQAQGSPTVLPGFSWKLNQRHQYWTGLSPGLSPAFHQGARLEASPPLQSLSCTPGPFPPSQPPKPLPHRATLCTTAYRKVRVNLSFSKPSKTKDTIYLTLSWRQELENVAPLPFTSCFHCCCGDSRWPSTHLSRPWPKTHLDVCLRQQQERKILFEIWRPHQQNVMPINLTFICIKLVIYINAHHSQWTCFAETRFDPSFVVTWLLLLTAMASWLAAFVYHRSLESHVIVIFLTEHCRFYGQESRSAYR